METEKYNSTPFLFFFINKHEIIVTDKKIEEVKIVVPQNPPLYT